MADMDREKNLPGGQKPAQQAGHGEPQPGRPGQGEQQPGQKPTPRPGQPQQPDGPDRNQRGDEESGQPVQLDRERRQEGPQAK